LFAWHKAAFWSHIDAIWGWDDDWQHNDFARLLVNARARRFYETLGFKLIETTASHWRMIWHTATPAVR
jgi:hypothetical protein